MLKISIITVVFNGESLLEGTIQSVANQTYKNIEYVIVDGASKDNTLDIIKKNERFIAKWISERDKGIYDGMNKGLHLATGDFVCFLNCGDHLFAPNTIELIVNAYTENTDILYGDVMMVNDAREPIGTMPEITPHRLPKHLAWRDMKYGMNVCHQSFYVRRSIAPDYIMGNLAADIDWAINCLKRARKATLVPAILSSYLVGGISKQRYKQSMLDRYQILKKHFGFLPNIWNHSIIVLRAILFKFSRRGKATY